MNCSLYIGFVHFSLNLTPSSLFLPVCEDDWATALIKKVYNSLYSLYYEMTKTDVFSN